MHRGECCRLSRPVFLNLGSPSDFRGVAQLSTNFLKNDGIFKYEDFSSRSKYVVYCFNENLVQFISSLFFMMFLGIGIIRTEKCWPNSPTYSTDVGVLRGWGRAQITVRHFGS